MTDSNWQAEVAAAGVVPGRRLTFVMEYTGGGITATVERVQDGIVFLSTGLRLRWNAVIGVRDESLSTNEIFYDDSHRGRSRFGPA